MFKSLYLALFIALLVAYTRCDESGESGGSDESDSSDSGSRPCGKSKENKKHEVEDMVKCDEPTPTDKCTCEFTDWFKNQSNTELDSCEHEIVKKCIVEIEKTVLINISWGIAKRMVMLHEKFEKCFKNYPNIHKHLKHKKMKKYGKNNFQVKDIKGTAFSFSDETIASPISLDGGNNCKLFDALRSGCSKCGTATTVATTPATTPNPASCTTLPGTGGTGPTGSTGATGSTGGSSVTGSTPTGGSTGSTKAVTGSTPTGGSTGSTKAVSGSTGATGSTGSTKVVSGSTAGSAGTKAPRNCSGITANVEILIVQIRVILLDVNLVLKEQLAQIGAKLKIFFEENSGAEELLEEEEISGFFSFKSFTEVTIKYEKSTKVTQIMSGDDATNCPLLKALKKKYTEAQTDSTISQDKKDALQAFFDIVDGIFKSTSDPKERTKQFQIEYYQITKNIDGLEDILSELELLDGISMEDLIDIIANIELPEVDCSQIETLLDPVAAGGWNKTTFIQSFYKTYSNWNKTYNFHGYKWGVTQFSLFRNAYLNANISIIINDTSMTYSKKITKIGAVMDIFIGAYTQKQFFYCIPLGDSGMFLSDFKKCARQSPAWSCEVPRSCVGDRNKLIKKKADGTTDFGNGWKAFFDGLDAPTKSQVQTYNDNINAIIDGAEPAGGVDQQIDQIVKELKNLQTAVPTVATQVKSVKVGSFGKVDKFCKCQDTATNAEYTS